MRSEIWSTDGWDRHAAAVDPKQDKVFAAHEPLGLFVPIGRGKRPDVAGGVFSTAGTVLGKAWADGYFCASGSAVDEEAIRRYIENRPWEGPGKKTSKSPCCGSLKAGSQPGTIQATFSRNQTHGLSGDGGLDGAL